MGLRTGFAGKGEGENRVPGTGYQDRICPDPIIGEKCFGKGVVESLAVGMIGKVRIPDRKESLERRLLYYIKGEERSVKAFRRADRG